MKRNQKESSYVQEFAGSNMVKEVPNIFFLI